MKRMPMKVLGVGLRRSGIGKNGKPYDFVECCFAYKSRNMEGVAAVTQIIPGETLDSMPLMPGITVDCLVSWSDYKPYVCAVVGLSNEVIACE